MRLILMRNLFLSATLAILFIFILLFLLTDLPDFRMRTDLRSKGLRALLKSSEIAENSLTSSNVHQHGEYWILYHYIKSPRMQYDNMSIALATHAEFTDLYLLKPLLERWYGPISITLLANGADFEEILKSLRYLRACGDITTYLERALIINLCIHEDHLPAYVPKTELEIFGGAYDCRFAAPYAAPQKATYRQLHGLEYPINLMRNIARLAARTYYTMSVEINMMPSPKFIYDFFKMTNDLQLEQPFKSVFCVPLFRIPEGSYLPENKRELRDYIKKKVVHPLDIEFRVADYETPNQKEWLQEPDTLNMTVFNITKRSGSWNPYYVTVNKEEPLFDGRLKWDNIYNKVAQVELLMHLDFDFVIVNGAFLVEIVGNDTESDAFPMVQRPFDAHQAQQVHSMYMNQLLALYGHGY